MTALTTLMTAHLWLPSALQTEMYRSRLHLDNEALHLEVHTNSHRMEIEKFFIDYREKRKGFGSAIVRVLQQHCREHDLTLRVNYPLPESVPFWKKMGFVMSDYHGIWVPEKIPHASR